METLLLMLDTIALMVVIYFSYKGGKSPENPEIGPFRIRPFKAAEKGDDKRKIKPGRRG